MASIVLNALVMDCLSEFSLQSQMSRYYILQMGLNFRLSDRLLVNKRGMTILLATWHINRQTQHLIAMVFDVNIK